MRIFPEPEVLSQKFEKRSIARKEHQNQLKVNGDNLYKIYVGLQNAQALIDDIIWS